MSNRIDNGVLNFAVYENVNEFYGMAELKLPSINTMTEKIQGAGIAGSYDGGFVGHIDAMSMSINFRSVTAEAIKLIEPYEHQIEFRVAQQSWDRTSGKFLSQGLKYVARITPTKFEPGKVAPASAADVSGDYSVSYFATYIDGKKVIEIDIFNFIFFINGYDYLADARKILGKE